jgi:hypothetical protein
VQDVRSAVHLLAGLRKEDGGVSFFTGSGVPLVPDSFLFGRLALLPFTSLRHYEWVRVVRLPRDDGGGEGARAPGGFPL